MKTDRRDVAALAEACRQGIYRPAHRRSAQQRAVQWQLTIRRELVATRTRAISVVRAITRHTGYRIAGRGHGHVSAASGGAPSPVPLEETLSPVRKVREVLDEELAQADAHVEALIADDPIVKRLSTCPSIGAITAAAFVAARDDVGRCAGPRGAAQVTS